MSHTVLIFRVGTRANAGPALVLLLRHQPEDFTITRRLAEPKAGQFKESFPFTGAHLVEEENVRKKQHFPSEGFRAIEFLSKLKYAKVNKSMLK